VVGNFGIPLAELDATVVEPPVGFDRDEPVGRVEVAVNVAVLIETPEVALEVGLELFPKTKLAHAIRVLLA
jgi:hypothetical protein